MRMIHDVQNPFVETLIEGGCTLAEFSTTLNSVRDQSSLVKHISAFVRRSTQSKQSFIDGFMSYVEDNSKFMSLLAACSNSSQSDGTRHNSIVRTLLMIKDIQLPIVEALLGVLTTLTSADSHSVARQILSQIRWLDFVFDGAAIAQLLIDCLPVLPDHVKLDVIAAAPEIVDDANHPIVAKFFVDWMKQDAEYTLPLLDSLGNLSIPADMSRNIVDSALELLISAKLEDLPLLLRFLFQACTANNSAKIVKGILACIKLGSIGRSTRGSNYPLLVLDSVHNGVKFYPIVTKTFLAELKALTEGDLSDLEIWWLLFAACSTSLPAARSIVGKKIEASQLRPDVFSRVFASIPGALPGIFSGLTSIASSYVMSKDHTFQSCGIAILKSLFVQSTDPFIRQEVLAAMLSHIGSGVSSEVDIAMDGLYELVSKHTNSVRPWEALIKGLIDFLHTMPDEHARKLLSVFAILAARKSESGVSVAGSTVPLTVDVNSELYILIRKQLSLSNLKLKRIGIMGAIALLCELAPRSLSTEIETSTISICSDLTLMLLQSCDNNMVAMAFLCDEISRCAPRLHLTLVNRFNDSFTIPKLEQLFIVDVDNEKVNFECSMPLHPWFNLNGSDGVIGLNILGKLFSPDVTERASVLVLTPLFRLGSILLMELGQGLGPIDAMLGCPFVLFDPMCLPDFEQLPMNTRVIYCSALIVCLNLLRELVNAFSSPSAHLTDDDSMPKVCSRMHQVLELQSILARCLNGMPLFVPLGSDELPAAAALDRSLQACTALVAASSKKQSGEKLATIAAFAPRFRAFDIHVFNLLSLPLSGGLEAANSRLHISPACLQYLLKELLEFIQKSLGDKSKSASTSMQPFQLMPFLVPIFQHLGKHLSSLIAEMDKPSVDGDAHADEHSGIDLLGASDRKVTLADCSRLLLEILSAVLNADCLRNNDGHISQSKCVEALAGSAVKVDQFKSVFNKLEALIASLDFSGVVLGIKIMEKLLTLSADLTGKTMTMARTELGSLVHIQLAKTWPTSAKFKADSLGYLVALEISLCVDPIELIERLVLQVFPTIAENGDEPATEIDIHATLNRSTIALYYRSVFAQLIAQVEERMSETHSGITNSVSSRIVSFEKCASIFSNLLTVAKRFAATNSTILSIAIKQGRRFVDVICGFLSFVSVQFTTHREIVMTGIRLMQVGTRNLQAMCEHGKRERDVSVTAVVPFVKRSLEDFMYGVKSMFQQHQLLSAFKVGNLKAKALDGTVLSSQEDIESEKEEESEQQQLPARLSLRRNTKAAKSKEQEPASDDDQGHASESDHSIAEEPIGKGKLAQQSRSRQPKRARSESEPEDDEEADDVDESENEATESDQVSDELTDDEQPDEDQYDSAMLADSSEEDPEVEEDEEPVRKKRHSKQLSSSARRKLKHLKRSRRHNDDDEAEEQEY